jgi:hypothetical protein
MLYWNVFIYSGLFRFACSGVCAMTKLISTLQKKNIKNCCNEMQLQGSVKKKKENRLKN